MDEILRHPRPDVGSTITESLRPEVPTKPLRGKSRRVFSAVQAMGRGISTIYHKLDNTFAGHKFLSPLPFLAIAGIAAAALVISTVYSPSYVVTVDGNDLGIVVDPVVFDRVVERVENRASTILGHEYTLDHEVEYSFALSQDSDITPISAFETYLFNQVGAVMKSYVLTVDGEFIGASANKAELESMLEHLSAPYVTENTTSVGYVEDVHISYEYISSDVMQDLVSMEEILSANTTGETTYEVVKGDTYSGIAHANDMSLDELMALNPEASLDRLMIGDVLTVKKTIPYLSIRTVDTVTYNDVIARPVEEVEDSSMYQGERKVLTAGSDGEALVTANVTYVNGYEEGREITSSTTLVEPTTEVVAVGTKPRPRTMPTGTFKWPVSGRITSYFGYRTIFGTYSYHGGLDIATAHGKAITASDGGTVIWSGYKGTYGYLVIIDHGNGVQSYYGHCSKLLVSAGDKVYQGQTIARVGSTGRSTGDHCHFEIRINGTRVNPLSYLP